MGVPSRLERMFPSVSLCRLWPETYTCAEILLSGSRGPASSQGVCSAELSRERLRQAAGFSWDPVKTEINPLILNDWLATVGLQVHNHRKGTGWTREGDAASGVPRPLGQSPLLLGTAASFQGLQGRGGAVRVQGLTRCMQGCRSHLKTPPPQHPDVCVSH